MSPFSTSRYSRMLFRMCSCTGASIIERNHGTTKEYSAFNETVSVSSCAEANTRITTLSTNGMLEITSVSRMRCPCTHKCLFTAIFRLCGFQNTEKLFGRWILLS